LRLPSLALRFSERKLLLLLLDTLMINAALLSTLMFRSNTSLTVAILWERLPWFMLLTGLWITISVILSIYDLARAARILPSLWTTSSAICLTGLIYTFIPYVTPTLPRYRMEVFLFPLLAIAGVGLWRIIYAQIFVQPIFHQRALVIGGGCAGETLANVMAKINISNGTHSQGTGYHLLGFIDDAVAPKIGVQNIPYLGTSQDLVRLARELRPDEVVVAIPDPAKIHGELFQAILDCRQMGIAITTLESLYERLTGRIPLESAHRQLSIGFPANQSATHRFYLVFRRLLDLCVGIVGCILVVLIMPFVWLANQISSPGPLFYRQQRVGKSGKEFTLIKFRSMMVDAEKDTGPVWAAEFDQRVTPVGRLLRKTRLDEAPQFWNVLKGEMSLIGPRPERPEIVAQLAQQSPFYRARHAIRPGITGWAQVEYRYGASITDARIKLQYDLYYIKHRRAFLDLVILLRTIKVVMGFKGR
jgi:exopolysaccharide biosynthesis polyprenyl glycosylphosphotransferase